MIDQSVMLLNLPFAPDNGLCANAVDMRIKRRFFAHFCLAEMPPLKSQVTVLVGLIEWTLCTVLFATPDFQPAGGSTPDPTDFNEAMTALTYQTCSYEGRHKARMMQKHSIRWTLRG